MSWIDDIRCLYCDGRLPLYRKITNGQFCSGAHRKAYWQEHERLAVERLHQTHDSLRAYRPPGAVEAILGPSAADEEASPLLPFTTEPDAFCDAIGTGAEELANALHSVAPLEECVQALHSVAPLEDHALPDGRASLEHAEPEIADLLRPPVFAMPRWLPDSLAAVDVAPFESANTVRWPVIVWAQRESSMAAAPAVPMAIIHASHDGSDTAAAGEPAIGAEISTANQPAAIYPNVDAAHPRISLTLNIVPDGARALTGAPQEPGDATDELRPLEVDRAPEDRIPEMAGMFALPGGVAREMKGAPALQMSRQVSPAPIVLRAQLPLKILRTQASLVRAGLLHAELLQAGLHQLPVRRIAPALSPSLQDGLRAIDLRAGLEPPLFPPPTPPVGLNLPRLSLAAGRRYRVETQPAAGFLAPPEPEGFAAMPPMIAMPERSVKAMAAGAMGSGPGSLQVRAEIPPKVRPEVVSMGRTAPDSQAHDATHSESQAALNPDFEPRPTGLLPLACDAKPSQPPSDIHPAPPALSLPQPLTRQPMRPDSKLEPLDEKPASDATSASQPAKPGHAVQYALHWTHALDFWNRAPRDLKMLVFAIPVLLGLALHPALPKVRVAAPAAATGVERNVERAFNDQWVNVRQTVFDRAAVALDEDFRSGLDDWTTRGDATAAWSFDATGFVRPGPLALYRPSMNLTDYQVQFLGMIDKQALSWVVRAADFDNFYVVKLTVLKSGPLPTIGVVRYAVVNGKADARVDTIAPLDARADMLYRVRMDVRGDDFALSVQGQMVDSWSEPRLKRGGIGFFSGRGEQSRLRWVQVTHQYDMLGRLCAYLAPYNIPSSSGGTWQP